MHEALEVWLAEMARKAGELPFTDVSQMTTMERLAGGETATDFPVTAKEGGLNKELERSDAAARFRLGLGNS